VKQIPQILSMFIHFPRKPVRIFMFLFWQHHVRNTLLFVN